MLNRREEYTDTMRKLLNDITMEVELFRSKMLAKDVNTVYDNSKEIIFYESVFEYFLYSENISKDVIKTCWTDSWLMENLWKLYLKEEFLKSEEYMTVLEGICHDWCTFDGINNDIKCFLLPSDIIDDDDKIDIFVKKQIGDILEKVKE